MEDGKTEYNKTGLFFLLGCVLFSFVFFAYIAFFSPPMDLAELEGDTPASALPLSAENPVDLSQITKPWRTGTALVAHGARVYQTYCATCHGKTGAGDGLAGRGLKPPPRNLITGGWRKGGDSLSLYQTLVQGIEGSSMVSFSYLSKMDRWALVHYVRSITKDKPADNIEKLKEFYKTAK